MKVEIYAGFGSLRERRWHGSLDTAPLEGELIALPFRDESYRVDRRVFRLDKKPPIVEIYVR